MVVEFSQFMFLILLELLFNNLLLTVVHKRNNDGQNNYKTFNS